MAKATASSIANSYTEVNKTRGVIWVEEINAWIEPQQDGTHKVIDTKQMRRRLGKYMANGDYPSFTDGILTSSMNLLDIYQDEILQTMKETSIALKDGWLNVYTFEFTPFAPDYNSEKSYDISNRVRFDCWEYTALQDSPDCPPSTGYTGNNAKWKRHSTKDNIALLSFPFAYGDIESLAEDTKKWQSFLADIFVDNELKPDPELIDIVSLMVGYCFVPHLESNKIFFLAGPTASNGKSTFLKILQKLFPPRFVAVMKFKAIISNSGQNWDKADLVGKRLLICNEEQSKDINASELKEISDGMTTIRAARKYQDPFDLRPTFTTICSFNTPPQFDRVDEGTLRRFLYIPCNNSFDGKKNARELVADILTERTNIQAWAILQAKRLAERKWRFPKEPVSMLDAKTEYLRSQNSALDFSSLNYVRDERIKGTPSAQLYNEYVDYCKEAGCKPFGMRNFSQICHKGILGSSHASNGMRYRRCRKVDQEATLDL